jgi:transcriptional regulator with XRE-family HTH domain
MTPENRARAHAATLELLDQMPLQELRRAHSMSQQTLAEAMDVPQSAISKIEQRTDAYISTLRRYLEAMGGTLRIVAEFPDGKCVEIDQFATIGNRSAMSLESSRARRLPVSGTSCRAWGPGHEFAD